MSDRACRDILLVHGSCHGAWCWHRVIPALTALGYRVHAPDLPGRGPTAGQRVTLDDLAAALCAALPAPALVVGHSAAGYAITAAAERDPSRMRGLVYLCAYLPVSGQSLAQMRRAGPSQPLAPALRGNRAAGSFHFDPAQCAALFYHDCPAEDVALAAAQLCDEPILPQDTPLTLTPRSQSLPRHYIRCTEDRAIPPDYQAQMAKAVPESQRHSLPCGHSPFFACPEALAQRLDAIAQSLPAA